jgi:uncharacterized coiled-coil protein SlyX
MSEERFDRIEAQISSLSSLISQGLTGVNQRMTDIEDRMAVLETTLSATMRGGFNNLRGTVNDIDADLAKVEQRAEDSARKVRRLNQRLMHLEGRGQENETE